MNTWRLLGCNSQGWMKTLKDELYCGLSPESCCPLSKDNWGSGIERCSVEDCSWTRDPRGWSGSEDSGAATTQLVTASPYVRTSRPPKIVRRILCNQILFHETEKFQPVLFKSRQTSFCKRLYVQCFLNSSDKLEAVSLGRRMFSLPLIMSTYGALTFHSLHHHFR